jgi:hypothetical protein
VRINLDLSLRVKELSFYDRQAPTFMLHKLTTPSTLPVKRVSPSPGIPFLGENSMNLIQDYLAILKRPRNFTHSCLDALLLKRS